MNLQDIKLTEGFTLTGVELYMKGDLKGYVNAYLLDEAKDREYEVLYRVYDPQNGDEYKLVSIDYGWNLDDEVFDIVEQKITSVIKNTNHCRLYEEVTL